MRKRWVAAVVGGWLGCLGLSACASAPVSEDAGAEAWTKVLRAAGLTKKDVGYDELDLAQVATTDREIPYFKAYHRDPLRSFSLVKILRRALLESSDRPAILAEILTARLGESVRRSMLNGGTIDRNRRAAAEKGAFVRAIEGIHRDAGRPLSAAESRTLRAREGELPPIVRENAAFVLESSRAARTALAKELAKLDAPTRAVLRKTFLWSFELAKADLAPVPPEAEAALQNFDFRRVFATGLDLIETVFRAERELREHRPEWKGAFDWDTPIGRIAVHGAKDDVYPAGRAYLFLLDTGGNDTYYSGGAASERNPVSTLIDLAGNDRYLGDPALADRALETWPKRMRTDASAPAFGSGIFGFGLLVDSAGKDLYRSGSNAFGHALFGMGMLWDREGDDRYDCFGQCLGAGNAGIGLLLDGKGRDRYQAFTQAEGFGGPSGIGLLLDAGTENDFYEANDRVRDLVFKNGTEHNVSMAQGAGCGWRGDLLDGRSLSGGIGILMDGGGNNEYVGGIFAQGVGYWHGLGILSSGKGDDRYSADYYGQGASAHFAVGVLHDEGGNDRYRATEYQAMGHGRDLSNGILFDEAGDDVYEAPSLSLGFGDLGGIGVFWDKSGNDRYVSKSPDVLGAVRNEGAEKLTSRSRVPTLGIFFDGGGKDVYEVPRTDVGSSRVWRSDIPSLASVRAGSRGVGADLEAPDTADPN